MTTAFQWPWPFSNERDRNRQRPARTDGLEVSFNTWGAGKISHDLVLRVGSHDIIDG